MVRKKKQFQHIWKEDILINYNYSKNIVFNKKNIINEDVHSTLNRLDESRGKSAQF